MDRFANAERRAQEVLEESRRLHAQTVRQTAQRVLAAFRSARVGEYDFAPSVGYGYGDRGRETLNEVFAGALGCEAALVRQQIASGTHAIALALWGVLRPGGELLVATGEPYDTLQSVLGLRETPRSFREWGIRTRVVGAGIGLHPTRLREALSPATQAVLFQRSRGYHERPALLPGDLEPALAALRGAGVVSIVDNCYGEFVAAEEPSADLLVGSLTKNPGGGLALGGGYVAGRRELVAAVADRLTAPGLGADVGSFPGGKRELFQGIFLAPQAVGEALCAADYAAAFAQELGCPVDPQPLAERGDIVQVIRFGAREPLLRFARALQEHSPIESTAVPEPAQLPGYPDAVIMAGGTFVAGSSLELSMDAPLRPPFDGYLQGGISSVYAAEILRRAFLAAEL